MKEREKGWETKQPSESRWPGTRGLGCHVRPMPDLLHRRHPAATTGARGEARPNYTSSCFAFSQGFCCKDASRTWTARWAPPLNLPWVFHRERTLLYMYNFCFKVFFKQNIYMLFIYLFKRLRGRFLCMERICCFKGRRVEPIGCVKKSNNKNLVSNLS